MALNTISYPNHGPPLGRNHYRRMQNANVSFGLDAGGSSAASVYRTVLFRRLAGKRESRFGRAAIQYLLREVFSKRGAMFEPVAGATAREPHIIYSRVPVDQKITVGSIFVLAHTRFHDRRVCQGREALRHVGAYALEGFRGHHTCLSIRINAFAVTIESDLEAARFQVRHAVHFVRLNQPGWQWARGKS